MQANVESDASDSDDSEFETASEADSSDEELDRTAPPQQRNWRVLSDVVLPLTGMQLCRCIVVTLLDVSRDSLARSASQL